MRVLRLITSIFGIAVLLMSFILLLTRQQTPRSPWIVFVSDREGFSELYRMYTDGSHTKRLTFDASEKSSPRWSPDGKWIAYVGSTRQYSSNNSGGTQLGGNLVYLRSTINRIRSGGGKSQALLDTQLSLPSLTWSPDGEQLAFTARIDDQYGVFLYRPTDPASLSLLVANLAPENPVWSPNGQWIVFENWDTYPNTLYHVQPDGSHLSSLFQGSQILTDPAWSPDGRWLAVQVTFNDGVNPDYLGLIPTGGGALQKVPNTATYISTPTRSPDGQWIVFTQNFKNLYRIRPNGDDLTQLTNGQAYDSEPVWSPVINLPLRTIWLLAAVFGSIMIIGISRNRIYG